MKKVDYLKSMKFYQHKFNQGFQKGHPSYLTEESKKKISETLKKSGHKPPISHYWLGKKRSIEDKLKISIANTKKGKPYCLDCGKRLKSYRAKRCSKCSGMAFAKIRATIRKNKGYKHSEETKRKISISNKGKNKGQHSSPKTEFKKGSMGFIGKHTEKTKKILSLKNKGKKLSTLTRKKMSEARKKEWTLGIRKIRIGEDSPNWKGGRTSIQERLRNSLAMRLWKKSVLERDNFTCQKTGQRGGRLIVHHINNFADFSELRFAIDNGITLSYESHNEFHKIYGKRNNTKEQLEEFLCLQNI